ncbi:hydrogenase maturation nickel metallochaperone HypA [Sciscionella marina]|uniref:hydrogenase maturation nickel metallochaperone HypA/HybF n=1 Tax=Sciscionella marina TaxID=508770 RepID=UPI00036811C1|nr:hydrogenase maturation nickel metallochaperone HypA [Sciscionella marina]
MHELAISEQIVEGVAERMGTARIVGVRLEVGKLSGVLPDALRFCFELATEGTTLEGARLDIEEPDARAHCRGCGADFSTADQIVLCACGSAEVDLRSGTQLRIRSVEVM